MPQKSVVPKPITQKIGSFGLRRAIVNRLLAVLHSDLPHSAADVRSKRFPDDERCFLFRVLLLDGDVRHFFVIAVDDVTSPDHLIVSDIRYSRLPSV